MFGFNRSSKQQAEPNVVNRVGDYFGWMGLGSGKAPALSHKTALESSTVLTCVSHISAGIASAPLRLIEHYEEDGLQRTRIATKHQLHKLLQRPNTFQTSFEFVEGMVANAVLGKGALAIKVRVGSEVRELLPVPSGSWVQEQLADGSYQFRVNYSDGVQHLFKASDCLFFRGLSLDGYSSVSAIEAARSAVGIASGLEGASLNSATSGGRPSGILTFTDGMSPEVKEKIRTNWQERYKAGGEGGVAVLDGSTVFTPIQMTAADSQFIENRRFQVLEIGRIFGVHPAFLFDEKSAINSEIRRFHVQNTLMPWFKRFEQALNRDLLNNDDRYGFDFDEMDLLRGDYAALTPFFQAALGNGGHQGFLSVNEIRHELGKDPINEKWAKTVSRGGYELSALEKGKADADSKA